MDLSIEAIENDLNQAEAKAGNPVAAVHLARAQVRATLIAAGYGSTIPDQVPEPETVTVRASLVAPEITIEPEAPDDEVDADFFGEAKQAHKGRKK